MQLIRYLSSHGTAALGLFSDGRLQRSLPDHSLYELLRLRADAFREHLQSATQASAEEQQAVAHLLAPIDGNTEVWAAGVTYKRSEVARREESGTPDIYSHVYSAARPELFFKANPRRVAGPDVPVALRADSNWDVPEPELALVINAHGEIVGFTIGNDVSSRSIEGENPLYLPQAKVYAGSCALGPGITPFWEVADPYNLTIRLLIERLGKNIWEGQTSTSELKRRFPELVEHLFREDDFPDGVVLCTGTALVPDSPFTLQAHDTVQIAIDTLGTLRNPVVVGKAAFAASRILA